jgi:hypothetical protein
MDKPSVGLALDRGMCERLGRVASALISKH